MIKKLIKLLVFSAFAVILVSCSSYPTELVDTANKAVAELSVVQPDVYAVDEYATLNDSLTGAITEAESQKSKFLFRNYNKVSEELNGVISYAEVVKTQAIENKAQAKKEVLNVLANIKTVNEESITLLPKAPKGKEGRAALIVIKSDISLIGAEYESINSKVETSDNLYILLDKAKASELKALSVNQELKDAINKTKK